MTGEIRRKALYSLPSSPSKSKKHISVQGIAFPRIALENRAVSINGVRSEAKGHFRMSHSS